MCHKAQVGADNFKLHIPWEQVSKTTQVLRLISAELSEINSGSFPFLSSPGLFDS